MEYFFEENCYINELLNTSDDPAVSVARVRVIPGATTRWHHLNGITERYLIIEGSGWVELGEEAPRQVNPGDAVTIFSGGRQRITNDGTIDLIFLAVCTPRFVSDKYFED